MLDKTLRNVTFCLRILIDLVSDITFRLLYWQSRRGLPPVTKDFLLESATSLAAKIRNKKITSEELVRACIERIGEIQSLLNAVVDQRFADAIEEAQKVDRIIASLEGPALSQVAIDQPFLGVPFSTKEGIRVAGLHHSYGLTCRRNVIAGEDSTAVQLLRRAGGIPICVTNVSELGMWWESSNYVYGTTNNPYNLGCSPGGSSGGEAALQSSAGIPLSICSDTGGSIRTPAAFCGLFGHKATPGIVSTRGADTHDPSHTNVDRQDIQVLGPISKHAEDLLPVLSVLVGDNAHLLQLDQDVFLTKLRYFYLDTDVGGAFVSPVDPEIRLAGQRVIDYLEDHYGVHVARLDIPALQDMFALFSQAVSSSTDPGSSICSNLTNRTGSAWVSWEWMKWFVGQGRHTLPSLSQALFERVGQMVNMGAVLMEKGINRSVHDDLPPENQALEKLKSQFCSLLGDNGVMLSPSHPTVAVHHCQSYTKPLNFLYTAMHNALGLPATVVPLGLGRAGLPLSIQISAGPYMDHLTLAVARELERPFGGWMPPFGSNTGTYY